MAGYMTKFNKIYDGEKVAAVNLLNGDFVKVVDDEVTLLDAAVDTTVRVVELEGPYGMPGLRLIVAKEGFEEVFMVENLPEGDCAYDETLHEVKAGEFARIHRLVAGEQFLVSVDADDLSGVAVGDTIIIGEAPLEFKGVASGG